MDKTVLSGVLQPRLDEVVSERLPRILLGCEDAAFAVKVRDHLRPRPAGWTGKCETWFASDADCLSFLRALCVGEHPPVTAAAAMPSEPFTEDLLSSARDPQRRFRLLRERYACPLNISFSAEDAIREHILMRTMVQDRSAIERGTYDTAGSDDLLLRLNLIAVHAASSSDLRFLDSLNYYYELLPQVPWPAGEHKWLWLSFLVLYARALTANI